MFISNGEANSNDCWSFDCVCSLLFYTTKWKPATVVITLIPPDQFYCCYSVLKLYYVCFPFLFFQHTFTHVVLVSMLVSTTLCIRVDFNTNTGPIRPPTPSPPPLPPRQPYVEPAPVWEDQSNDIPNPNPYR